MPISEKLQFLITADGAQAIRAFQTVGNAAERELGKAESKLDKAGAGLTKFGVGAMGAALVAGGALGKMAQGASNLNETLSKSRVIFGTSADAVEAFGDTAAKALGQSKQAAIDAASTFGVFGKAAGLTGGELVAFSTKLSGLASDLASFSNTSPEEAVQALGAALRGESEPIRRYGVMLDEATLKQRALELGLISTTTGTLPPAIKMQAAYAEILAQTKDAQGDFARTSDGLANQQRILKASLKDLADGIGAGALPMLTSLVSTASSAAGAFNALSPGAKAATGTMLGFGTAALGAVGAISAVAGQAIKMRDRFVAADGALTGAGKTAVVAGAAIVGLGVVMAALEQRAAKARAEQDALTDAMARTGKSALEAARASLYEYVTRTERAQLAAQALGLSSADLADALTGERSKYDELMRTLDAVNMRNERDVRVGADLRLGTHQLQVRLRELRVAYDAVTDAQLDKARAHVQETKDLAANAGAQASRAAGLQATAKAFDAVDDAQVAATASLDDYEKASKNQAKAADEARKAEQERADAIRDSFDAAEAAADPTLRLRDAERDLARQARDVAAAIDAASKAKEGDAEASEKVQEAQDELVPSLSAVGREYANTSGAAKGSKEWAEKYVARLLELRPEYAQALGPAIAEYDKIIARLQAAILAADIFAGKSPTERGAAGYDADYGGLKAGGGEVRAGRAYKVGERGSEWFVPSTDGDIATTANAGAMPASAGGAALTLNVNLAGPIVTQDGAQWVADALARVIRTQGTGFLTRLGVTVRT